MTQHGPRRSPLPRVMPSFNFVRNGCLAILFLIPHVTLQTSLAADLSWLSRQIEIRGEFSIDFGETFNSELAGKKEIGTIHQLYSENRFYIRIQTTSSPFEPVDHVYTYDGNNWSFADEKRGKLHVWKGEKERSPIPSQYAYFNNWIPFVALSSELSERLVVTPSLIKRPSLGSFIQTGKTSGEGPKFEPAEKGSTYHARLNHSVDNTLTMNWTREVDSIGKLYEYEAHEFIEQSLGKQTFFFPKAYSLSCIHYKGKNKGKVITRLNMRILSLEFSNEHHISSFQIDPSRYNLIYDGESETMIQIPLE